MHSEGDDRKVVGTREAARLGGVSESTIRNYKETGLIGGRRNPINNRREIFADDAVALRRR